MSKENKKTEQPKAEAKSESKEKKQKWTMNKPNPKTAPEQEVADVKMAQKAKSITTSLSEKHTYDGGRPRVEKPLFTKKIN